MAGWHHRLDGCEFEWTPEVGDGQGGLECCDSWGLKESDTTEQLNRTELNWMKIMLIFCYIRNCYFSCCNWRRNQETARENSYLKEIWHVRIQKILEILPCFISPSVQLLSRVRLLVTPWTTAHQAFLSITNSQSSFKLISIKSVMPSSHVILCHPLLLLPPIPPSIRVFSNESTLCMRWPKYWSFSFSIIPSKEHPGLISFRMDWLDLLAIQYLKSFPFCSPYLP